MMTFPFRIIWLFRLDEYSALIASFEQPFIHTYNFDQRCTIKVLNVCEILGAG